MWPFRARRPSRVAFEDQLACLGACGIGLAEGVAPSSLLASFTREQFEEDPYELLLTVLGSEAELPEQAGPSGYPSDAIWHFDTECIDGDEAYVAIAKRLGTLARGELPLEALKGVVDFDENKAWLSFRLEGREYRWEPRVEDDWVDPMIFTKFSLLLDECGRGRRFTYIDLGGQDCLIGCSTPRERSELAKRTGVKVRWMR